MRVLVTAGGTREPIDGVRWLGNASTGRTGAAIADALAGAGAQVTHLRASGALAASDSRIAVESFVTVAELDRACARLLGGESFTLVVHAAAVSDFYVAALSVGGVRHPAPFSGKLDSSLPVSVELAPGPKILPKLKGYSKNKDLRVAGFKLTDGASEQEAAQAVARVFASGADIVVHNDIALLDHAKNRHPATIYGPGGPLAHTETSAALALWLASYATSL